MSKNQSRRYILGAILILSTLLLCVACESKKEVTGQKMTLQLSYGSRTGTYTGTLVNNIPNGQGKFRSKNTEGDVWTYSGTFKDGHFQGQGTIWSNGQKEKGTYVNDKLNGFGKTYEDNILFYEGNYKDGQYNGSGKVFNKTGKVVYNGQFINRSPDKAAFKAACKYISYKDLARNPDTYKWDLIKCTGTVVQVIEGDAETQYRIAMHDDYDTIIYAGYTRRKGKSRVLENDTVTIWGFSSGLYTYESTMGGYISIPSVVVEYLDIK